MAPAEYDFIIVGGEALGLATVPWPTACPRTPATRVLVLEAGFYRTTRVDVYIHMPNSR